jgi:hypothetical protein
VLRENQLRSWILPLCLLLAAANGQQVAPSGQLHITVTGPNGQLLSGVFIRVEQNEKLVDQGRTTPSGIAILPKIPPGTYKLVIQQPGFYSASVEKVEVTAGQTQPVEVRLAPVREYQTQIEVAAQPSPIDPQQTASTQTLTATEIATIPYPTSRDYRNVLPYIPGVIADATGQIHVAGSSTQEIQDYLDGFEVSQPAGGALAVRVNPDSLRKIDVLSTRYSALFGKGSGGLTDLTIQDADNHFRFNATDFIPTVQNVKGIQFNNWTPRAYLSGPIVRDKAWFTLSHEGENDNNIVKQLPDGADTNTVWRTSDLVRVRMNLTPGNVLTLNALFNLFESEHSGISALDPVSVSSDVHNPLFVLSAKDQLTIAQNNLLEFGAAIHRSQTSSAPQGFSDYVFTPTGRTGNFFETVGSTSYRTQGFSNLYLRPWKHFGTHQVTLGGRVDKIELHQTLFRVPTQFVDQNNVLLRQITFQNAPPFSLSTLESSAYVQDRWSAYERLLIEAGGRWDRDSYLGRDFFSPRLAGTYLLSPANETKLSAGVGIYYDRTNLSMVSASVQGTVTDQFFDPTSHTITHTITTSFIVDPNRLTMPRFVNWSAGIESRLPKKVYVRLEFLSRHGKHGWGYELQPNGNFFLGTDRQDRYDAVQITARKEFKRGYPFLVAYTRSNARSNQTIDFAIDNFIVGPQIAGPLPWDAPNQLVSWGSFPLLWKLKKFDIAYSTIWRTGFPFNVLNQFGELVPTPSPFRFPDFFTLNVALERKFNFKGYRWAARIGLEDITDRQNATSVNNTIPPNVPINQFMPTFFGQSHRTLNGRIRFLGKATK